MKKHTLRRLSALIAASVMAVACGAANVFAKEDAASLTLTEAYGVAGQSVVVNIVLESGNSCTGYDIDVEFDDRLELTNVSGCMATETNGNVATVVNFTGNPFKDDKPVSSLTFMLPKDASENDSYDINVSRVGDIAYLGGSFENVSVMGTTINVLESAKKVTNHKVLVTEENGVEVSKVGLRGDADMDGEVGLFDAIKIATKMVSRSSVADPVGDFFADVNGDGETDLSDTIAICRFIISSDKSNAWGTII